MKSVAISGPCLVHFYLYYYLTKRYENTGRVDFFFAVIVSVYSLQFFQSYRTNVISMQTPNKQSSMSLCFEHLMDSIECNLLPKNRDRSVLHYTSSV